MVYLVCFDKPFKHARHYLGFTDNLEERINTHGNRRGSRLLKHVTNAGIGWRVVRIWDSGNQNFERRLKRRGGATPLCPACSGEKALKRGTV